MRLPCGLYFCDTVSRYAARIASHLLLPRPREDMPDLNVASCVLNILGSFQSSQGLYQRLREKRRKQKWSKRNDTAGREELRLSSSLRQGHDDIMLEYQQSLGAMGDHFAIGDGMSFDETLASCKTNV